MLWTKNNPTKKRFNLLTASTTDTGEPPYSMFEDPGVIKFTVLEDGKVIEAEPNYSFVGKDCAFSGDYEIKFELLPKQ